MTNRIIEVRERLLDISKRKTELLSSIVDHIDDIKDNPIFMEEIEELYSDLSNEEKDLIDEEEITMPCPDCGFECARIASFCMACGTNLHEGTFRENM